MKVQIYSQWMEEVYVPVRVRQFAKAAKLLDMEVLDHVIIGDGIYVSLHERGVI